jgi:hypothetical protein
MEGQITKSSAKLFRKSRDTVVCGHLKHWLFPSSGDQRQQHIDGIMHMQ